MPDAARIDIRSALELIPEAMQPPVLTSSKKFRYFIGGLLALASVYLACRDLVPGFSATLTTIAFGNRSLQWLEAST
jgi:hypothetical protein